VRREAAAEAPLDERGALGGGWALWRFHQGRSVPGLIIAPWHARSVGYDREIPVENVAFKMIGGVICGQVGAIGSVGDRGSRWHVEACGGKIGRWRCGQSLLIMAPWPAEASAARLYG
jgi:hypothetical protein